MRRNYSAALAETLRWEGGYSNHPRDPGGATMRGVTQRVYDAFRRKGGLPPRPVRRIAEDEVQAIYLTGYWQTIGGDTLAAGFDCSAFDLSVNSGPGRARKYIAATAAIDSVPARIRAFNGRRRSFLHSLKTWDVFGKGWSRRVNAIEAASLRMAGAPRAFLSTESSISVARAREAGQGAVVTGSAGGLTGASASLGVADWSTADIALACGLGALVLAALVYLIWRRNVQEDRAERLKEAMA